MTLPKHPQRGSEKMTQTREKQRMKTSKTKTAAMIKATTRATIVTEGI